MNIGDVATSSKSIHTMYSTHVIYSASKMHLIEKYDTPEERIMMIVEIEA